MSTANSGHKISLTDFKQALYLDEAPLLRPLPSLTEEEFLQLYFPKDFYEQEHITKDGKRFSLEKLLSNRKGKNPQRNKIFNRKYTGYILRDSVVGILSVSPDLWSKLVLACRRELSKGDSLDALWDYFRKIIEEMQSKAIRRALSQALPGKPELVLAAIILHLLIDGLHDRDGSDAVFLNLIQKTTSISETFAYLRAVFPTLKTVFGKIDSVTAFPAIRDQFYDDYSGLFSCIAGIKVGQRTLHYTHFLDALYDQIQTQKDRKLIKISSASGTEKKAITQMLFIRAVCDVLDGVSTEFAPFYVNLYYYEKKYGSDVQQMEQQIHTDLAGFTNFCSKHPDRVPLLFIDGIKYYSFSTQSIGYQLNDSVNRLPKARLVLSMEEGNLMNSRYQCQIPAYASGAFPCTVQIDSLYLQDRDLSISFLKYFQKIYHANDAESIYAQLKRVGIHKIDTYQLRLLLPRLEEATNIANLYDAVCSDLLSGDTSEEIAAAQWAFNFSYTDKDLPAISARLQSILTVHESFRAYYSALLYLSRIREVTSTANLSEINLVMPKGVTLFIVAKLAGNTADEDHIIRLVENNYHRMDYLGKSEMTYWLGRISSSGLSDQAEQLLLRFYAEQKALLKGLHPTDRNYMHELFLLRGLSVSLIVKGHVEISDEYLTSLLCNKAANEINRGFHLEYYGDKLYSPAYNTLDFKDDILKGKHTLDQLLASNEKERESGSPSCMFELRLITLCSLLQARVEVSNLNVSFSLNNYMEKVIQQANWYLKINPHMLQMLREYLKLAVRDFSARVESRNQKWGMIGADAYNAYSKRVLRRGWVLRGIDAPESVAEHMYHTWMIGMMFLPASCPELPEYSKDTILNLLLIHDIAEAVIGDIERPKKRENPAFYNQLESEEMGIFLLRSSYPGMADTTELYETWQLWNDTRNINGCIAREIDTIQAIHQLLTYLKESPERFEEDDVSRWLGERIEIRTAPGCRILQKLILDNSAFLDILYDYGVLKKAPGRA